MYLFQDTYKPTTESYTLSLHDALPILEEAEHGITANMICPGDITGDMKESNIQMAKSIRDQKTPVGRPGSGDRKSTRLNSSHVAISYAVFCLKKKNEHRV